MRINDKIHNAFILMFIKNNPLRFYKSEVAPSIEHLRAATRTVLRCSAVPAPDFCCSYIYIYKICSY